jgi:transcriptional regulator with XRE-family HTH domain
VITLKKKGKITNVVESLHQRYISDSHERRVSLETERVNADVAQAIYDLRKEAGLTQKELADLVGTTQSVISRLEDADYEGHSLSMLSRIAGHLNRRLVIKMVPLPAARQSPNEAILKKGEHRYQHPGKGFFSPGQIAPRSGRYQQIGPRGGRGKEVTVVKGEALPPTPREKMTYVIVGPKKSMSGAREGMLSDRNIPAKRKGKKAK